MCDVSSNAFERKIFKILVLAPEIMKEFLEAYRKIEKFGQKSLQDNSSTHDNL